MEEKYTLKNPKFLEVRELNYIHYGGSQEWYKLFWRRMSGCGPTSASNIIWYKSHYADFDNLWDVNNSEKSHFIALMEEMFQNIKPGMQGVNSTEMFINGAAKFASKRSFNLQTKFLNIQKDIERRPEPAQLKAFIVETIKNDLPVAFLNLSNGDVSKLDNWHWVTLIEMEKNSMIVTMIDQGRKIDIDIELWLKTTKIGGGFVALDFSL